MNIKPQKSWTNEEDELFKTMWNKHSKSDILLAFPDRKYGSLKSHARFLNIKKDITTLSHNKLSILLNECNMSYYWLGFLMADGHFSKLMDIKLTISEKDIDHITKFANLVSTSVKTNKGYCSIAVRDVNTVKVLKEKYSIHSNKTEYPCNISSFNTKESFLAWFSGFFDGDGCVLKRKGKVSGLRIQIHSSWIKNLEFISEKLKEYLNINSRSYIDTQGYARWVCFKDAGILIKEIQSLNLPIMERKLGFR